MVTLAFGQKVCGFDLLRSERGKSYVCDVNGWSFVKNSDKVRDSSQLAAIQMQAYCYQALAQDITHHHLLFREIDSCIAESTSCAM